MLHAIREEQRELARYYHEEKLEAANRAKTNFLGHLSHDIRTPLNHIIGFADPMRHQTYRPLGDAHYVDCMQSIKRSGEYLLASFAAILDLAELEGGCNVLRRDAVQIDKVLYSVMQHSAGLAARARLRLEVSQSCSAIVEGDQLGLVRMISNLVDNSVCFTPPPPGGQITLAAFAADDGVVLEITNTGLGMNADRLASLSQSFALGGATFTHDGVGQSLGISISQTIGQLSGGHKIINSNPSLGTTMAISLPLHTNKIPVAA
ncbi:MAG: HAMP domain-containing histidine kinase [Candidatus Devosia symbiotica]|nr:HAMP domain-containing histidine kinase [Candidatus Devosia symbiotica]